MRHLLGAQGGHRVGQLPRGPLGFLPLGPLLLRLRDRNAHGVCPMPSSCPNSRSPYRTGVRIVPKVSTGPPPPPSPFSAIRVPLYPGGT